MKQLEGKLALVTGSSSGIGAGVAHALAMAGADVILHGLEPQDKLDALAADLAKESGTKITAYSVDISSAAAMEKFLGQIKSQNVDILVNNAGLQFTSPLETFPKAKWDLLLQLHLTAPFELMQAVLPGMRARKWGRVIQIASTHGLVASKEKAAYVAAKHGIIGLTKVAALETAGSGITCNSICPGWVKTPLVEAQIKARAEKEGITVEKATHELLDEKQPSKTFTTPSELGALAVFLSSEAAGNMTGVALPMDGAWTAQ